MVRLLKQLFLEHILSGAKAYVASHPELGVPIGIFNTKDEPTHKDRVKSIKRYGKKGNPQSYKLALLLGIETPIPSYQKSDAQKIEDLEDEVDRLKRAILDDKKSSTKVTSGGGLGSKFYSMLEKLAKERTPMADMSVGDVQQMTSLINNMRKASFDVEGSMDQVLKLFSYEDTLIIEMSKNLGMSNVQLLDQVDIINQAAVETTDYALTANQLLAVFMSITKEISRNLYIPPDVMKRSALLTKTLEGFDASKFADAFDSVGYSLQDGIGGIDDTDAALTEVIETGRSMGVVMEKYLGNIAGNIKLINTYGFEDGVEGLSRMVARSQALGVDMGKVTALAEKFLDPEGAIDFAARMQVIGGAVGDLADPFKLMYMATNDLEGLETAIIDTAAAAVTFDKDKNKFIISPESRRMLRDQAEAMGMSYEEIAETAVKSARRAAVFSELEFVGDMSDTDKELIASMAQIGEGGTAQVKIPGIEEMVDVTDLTESQMELLRKEGMKDSDIYAQQLTAAEKSNQILAQLEAAARVQVRLMGGKATDVDAMSASQMLAKSMPGGAPGLSDAEKQEFEQNVADLKLLKDANDPRNDDQIQDLEDRQEELKKKLLDQFSGKVLTGIKDMFENAGEVEGAIIGPDGEITRIDDDDWQLVGKGAGFHGSNVEDLKSATTGAATTGGGGGGASALQVGGTITLKGYDDSIKISAKEFMEAFWRTDGGQKQEIHSSISSAV